MSIRTYMNLLEEGRTNILLELQRISGIFKPQDVHWTTQSDTLWQNMVDMGGVTYSINMRKNQFDDSWFFDFEVDEAHAAKDDDGNLDRFKNNGVLQDRGIDSAALFGQVYWSAIDFLKKKQPRQIIFLGDNEEGKGNLYGHLVRKGAGKLEELGYKAMVTNQPAAKKFIIRKIQPLV